jgi:hypothetical protein
MPLTVADFVHRWRIFSQTENAGAPSHFNDLCEILGEKRPAESDSAGENYAFQKHVSKTRGGKGFAGVWKRDHFGWEYKGKHKNLQKAYEQLLDYREDLNNPPLLVVCDLDRFEIHTNFTATSKRVYAFNLDDLNRNQVTATCPLPPLDVLRALFGDYNVLRPERTDEQVTKEAAKQQESKKQRLLFFALRQSPRPRVPHPSSAWVGKLESKSATIIACACIRPGSSDLSDP